MSKAKQRQKAELILKVRAGLMSASEAAAQLGVSRKTYYKWEKRGLAAMLEGLCERSSGRPPSVPDPEQEQLKNRVQERGQGLTRRQQGEELRKLLRAEAKKKG